MAAAQLLHFPAQALDFAEQLPQRLLDPIVGVGLLRHWAAAVRSPTDLRAGGE